MEYCDFIVVAQKTYPADLEYLDCFINRVKTAYEDGMFEDTARIPYLFYGENTTLSKSSFFRYKRLSILLFEYLKSLSIQVDKTIRYLSSVTLNDIIRDNEISTCFFRSEEEIINFLDLISDDIVGIKAPLCLQSIKAIVVLSWKQIDFEKASGLLKTDIIGDNVFLQNEVLHLTANESSILHSYVNQDFYYDFPRGRECKYKESVFLFRSSKSEHLTTQNISDALKRFNAIASKYGKRLSIQTIRKNSMLTKMRDMRNERTSWNDIQKQLNVDSPFLFGYKEYYERWIRVYFPAEAL